MKKSSPIKAGSHRVLFSKITCLLAISLFTACSPSLKTTRVQVSSGRSEVSLADRLNQDINSYRASKGGAALKRHQGLDAIAQKHCEYLASQIGNGGLTGGSANHDGFDGRVLVARRVHRFSMLGENVVVSTNHSSAHLLKILAKSKSHERNMRDKWTHIGIGVVTTPSGVVISTQEFGSFQNITASGSEDSLNQAW